MNAINSMKKSMVDLYHGQILKILDAGCGNTWPFGFDEIPYHLTGIDIDQKALDLRTDLHESICSDLGTINLPSEQYDIIYNSFVIEHVHNAEKMLLNFINWLKPGGILCIHFPDGKSVTGWMTKIMPYFIKVWAHKLKGNPNSGKPGYGPYPVVYEPIVCRSGMKWFCRQNDLRIEAEFLHTVYLTTWWLKMFAFLISICSLGSLVWSHEAVSMIIKK